MDPTGSLGSLGCVHMEEEGIDKGFAGIQKHMHVVTQTQREGPELP